MKPLVGIIFGSKSDWSMMEHAASILSLSIPKYRDVIADYRQKQADAILA